MNYKGFLEWDKYGQREELIKVFETIVAVRESKFSELTKLLRTFNLGSERTIRRMIIFFKYLDFIDIDKGVVVLKYKNNKVVDLDKLIFFKFSDLFFKHYPIEKTLYVKKNVNGDVLLAKRISLKHTNYRDLAISFNKLLFNEETSSYSVLSSDFSQYLMRKKSLESLEKNLEIQKENGLKGEQFVVHYEKRRLGKQSDVVRISDDDVMAGYDIKSFNSPSDIYHNRFIEVKTYSKNEKVYLSRNEISTSKLLRESYYLYVVNIACIDNEDYEPIIIRDLYKGIISNEDIPFEVELVSYCVSDINDL